MNRGARSSLYRIDIAARERAVLAVFAGAALAIGALAAFGLSQLFVTAVIVFLIVVAALTLPLPWVAIIVAVSIPLQFYFEIPGSSFTLRSAVVFVFAAAARLLAQRFTRKELLRWQTWMLPAALFLIAALIAALGAQSRYLAFKGIYDWLIIFATAFVIGEIAQSRKLIERLVFVLLVGGVAEAALGLVQYAVGLNNVLTALRLPASTLFYQPSLLRERLTDVSFNWVVFDRAAPFGTFINGIDFAIFVAAILGLALALLFAAREHTRIAVLFASVLLMGTALLLTFKGSGLLAFAGAAAAVALFSLRRLSPRIVGIGIIGIGVAIVLALPFASEIAQRAAFIVQREQGATGTAGRLEIWAWLFQDFLQRPIFGYGLNHAALMTEASRTLRYGAVAFNSPSAESAYVSALIETGLVGFAALMVLFAAVLTRATRYARADAVFVGILAALVALLLGNLTVAGFTTDQNGMLLGALIGMTFALNPRIFANPREQKLISTDTCTCVRCKCS
jgi:O-antigen ligase